MNFCAWGGSLLGIEQPNRPPTKAGVCFREAFLGEVLSKLADQAAALTERLDTLEERVAKLEEPKPKK